ncbi:hypothetical protein [Timonella senegalensis]|uniref:hypothetical protein n=1 Tax=Timonella senegalensis TaxID=1465825 RepID=UPI0028A926D3|nr:hypothetical protein [Timonella senegalensis]
MEKSAQSGFEELRQDYLATKPDSVEEVSFHSGEIGLEWALAGHRTQLVYFIAWIPDFWILSLFPLDEWGSDNIADLYSQEWEWGRPLHEIEVAQLLFRTFDRERVTVETGKLWGFTVDRSVRVGDTFLVAPAPCRLTIKLARRHIRRQVETFPPQG